MVRGSVAQSAGALALLLAVAACSQAPAAVNEPTTVTAPSTPSSVTGGCGGEAPASATGNVPSPACSHPPSMPPGTISEAAAIEAARVVAGSSAAKADAWTSVVQAYGGHTWAWGVRLNGPALRVSPCPSDYWDRSWPPSAPPCLDDSQGFWVLVDAFSGQVITTHY